ncbi:diguanylate cyclase domain-containing protein [Noviherbaspirillum pedocola]|uniref:Diguanylate cyclase n=1 Tax=Noviherbaspirillum pedocola TaxID=2801341 RepID=A0A934W9V4_9BURK|nr:sensor domain-containing diguanylate cyclase [Noviherbaspirillum pedocola]MBK4738718.1 diguanylate cyclase [Noviherbaspirillum pedocola]
MPTAEVTILDVNDSFLRRVSLTREDMVGKGLFEVFPDNPADAEDTGIEALRQSIAKAVSTGEVQHLAAQRFPIKKTMPNGKVIFEERFWNASNTPVFSPDGELLCIHHTTIEVTNEVRAVAALQKSEKRLTLALKAAGTAVWDMDTATQEIIPASDLVFSMLGYEPGEIITSSEWISLIHEEDLPGVREMIDDVIAGRRESYWRELRLRAKDGSWRWILSQATSVERDAHGRATRLVGMHTDFNERKLAEQRVREAALHDPLTGLPNRALLFEYGSHLIAAASRNHSRGALMFIDLDRFKPINDIYGHEIGDRVLQEVGRRLIGCTRQEDVVGRIGGDEFVIVLPHVDAGRYPAAIVAQHVIENISQPFLISNLELSLSPSIGISYYPEHATDMSSLIHTGIRSIVHMLTSSSI